MKLTRETLKKVIQEILRLNKDNETEEFGPPEEIDGIYHDSTRDDNNNGYTSAKKKPLKVRILTNKDSSEEK